MLPKRSGYAKGFDETNCISFLNELLEEYNKI